jgi:hypothetical protein
MVMEVAVAEELGRHLGEVAAPLHLGAVVRQQLVRLGAWAVPEQRLVVVGCQLARLVAVAGCDQVGLAVLLAVLLALHHVLEGCRLTPLAVLRLVAVGVALVGCQLVGRAALVLPPVVVVGCHLARLAVPEVRLAAVGCQLGRLAMVLALGRLGVVAGWRLVAALILVVVAVAVADCQLVVFLREARVAARWW